MTDPILDFQKNLSKNVDLISSIHSINRFLISSHFQLFLLLRMHLTTVDLGKLRILIQSFTYLMIVMETLCYSYTFRGATVTIVYKSLIKQHREVA